MIDQLKAELKKFDEKEDFFGVDFIENISWGATADAFLLKVYDYEPLFFNKNECFEVFYLTVINYLTEIKSRHVNNAEPTQTTAYYQDWLMYKCGYNIRKAWFYMTIQDENDLEEVTNALIDILGRANYHALLENMNTPNEDYQRHATNIMNYIGNTRAVRDLSMRYLDPVIGTQWQFHLWHMTPVTIIEDFGYVFYLGNELSSIKYCPYDYSAHEYYYSDFYQHICNNLDKDIPKNRGISQEEKERVKSEINKRVFALRRYPDACGFVGVGDDYITEDDDIVGWADFEDDSEDFDIEIDDDTATDFDSDSDEDD